MTETGRFEFCWDLIEISLRARTQLCGTLTRSTLRHCVGSQDLPHHHAFFEYEYRCTEYEYDIGV